MSIDDFPRYLRFPPSCVYQCQCTFLFSPASFLCSGGYFFGDKWAGKELPYVVHNNWIVGKANKLKRFKVFGVRTLPPPFRSPILLPRTQALPLPRANVLLAQCSTGEWTIRA
jgi:hypothetical protein